MYLLLVKSTTVNFLRLFAVWGRTCNFLRLLADRILNSLHLELLAEKAQFNFFLLLACSCGARTSCTTSCACIILGLYCIPGGGTPYNGLYGEALPERGTFFRLQVYKRVGISQVEVY